MAAPDLDTAATDPASASADGQSVTARPIPDLIALDNHVAGKAKRTKRRRGLLMGILVNPGAASDVGRTYPTDFDRLQ